MLFVSYYNEYDHEDKAYLTLHLVSYGPDQHKAISLAAICMYINTMDGGSGSGGSLYTTEEAGGSGSGSMAATPKLFFALALTKNRISSCCPAVQLA